ncbi:MAG: FAD-binding protein [Rhodocyclales bacterium]|nr:FAD-binding protein [Rhodocyclales bacterium]
MGSALASAGLYTFDASAALFSKDDLSIENITQLYPVRVRRQIAPLNALDVKRAIEDWPGQISVGGGRYSMGGQVAISGGLHLDMRSMKALVWIKPDEKKVRVQAGMRWRDLQDLLDPHNLSVRTMQSYANFTVGGSVSVNAHGRYVGHGPIVSSVIALQMVLANGQIVETSRSANNTLFAAAIGAYGALGAITEVELALDENFCIERFVESVSLDDYPDFFRQHVLADPASIMHNADLIPPSFNRAASVTWKRSDKSPTEPKRLIPRGQTYPLEASVLWAMTELPSGYKLRDSFVQPYLFGKPAVVWRNYEASRDVAMLEPTTRAFSTYILQEYFVPVRHFRAFLQSMAAVLKNHAVVAANVSVRHTPEDTESMMAWAREEMFSFVLYYKQRIHAAAQAEVGKWTRELIDLALKCEGTYYLPYQLHASQEQFDRAYPQAQAFRQFKRHIDPDGRFSNELWRKYL